MYCDYCNLGPHGVAQALLLRGVMKSFLIKRNSWIKRFLLASLIIVGASTIAKKESKDALDPVMSELEKSVDQALLDPALNYELNSEGGYASGSLVGYVSSRGLNKKDRKVGYDSPAFASVLAKAVAAKNKIELAAAEREKAVSLELVQKTSDILAAVGNDSKTSDALIAAERSKIQEAVFSKFSVIVARYFQIQKRLFANLVRNAHDHKDSNLFNATLHDKLNLKLNLAIGAYLVSANDLSLFYNLWHTRNPITHLFDLVELGLTPQDKNNIEQVVLEEKNDEYSYRKLIHLVSTRERIINQWAVERLSRSATKLAPPNLEQCVANDPSLSGLMSYKDQANVLVYDPGNYYDFLWKKDRHDEFVGTLLKEKATRAENTVNNATVLGRVAQVTFDRPILNAVQLESMLLGFLGELGAEVQPAPAVAVTDATAPKSLKEILNEVRKSANIPTLEEAYKGYVAEQVVQIEQSWKEKARAALMDANFMGDRWDDESVAERTALYAFQFRKKYLTDVLFFQALTLGKIPKGLTAVQYEPWYKKAIQKVELGLSAQRASWVAAQKANILTVLKSTSVKDIRLATKDIRLNRTASNLKPAMLGSAQGGYVAAKIDSLSKANQANGSWKQKGLVYFGNSYELGFIAARARLNSLRIQAWLPDQLTQFYFSKLEYWKTKVSPSHSYMPTLAQKIESDRRVMWGVKNFFVILNNNFMNEVQSRKLEPTDLNRENSPLYDVMKVSVQQAYQSFVEGIKEEPVQLNSPAPQSWANPSENTALKFKPVYDFKNYVTPADRKKVIDLYIQAMSVLNLGGFLVGATGGVDHYYFESSNKVKVPKGQEKFKVFSSKTFLKMELALLQDGALTSGKEGFMADRVFQSFLDQKLLAEVLKDDAISKSPLLAIQYAGQHSWLSNPDVTAPTVLDLATQSYVPATGLSDVQIQSALNKGLDHAVNVIPSLVVEACKAKSRVLDNVSFRNVFQGSRALRRTYFENNESFKKLDDKATEFTKTPTERALDKLNPILEYGFYALMIGMAIFFLCYAPVLLGFASTSLFGVVEGMATIGQLMIIPGLTLKGTFMIANMFVLPGVFAYQVALQYKVGCIEMPNQLRYQLKVSNSQVSELAKTQIAKDDLRWLSANIDSMYMNVQIGSLFQLIFIPQIGSQLKMMMGTMGLKALERLETVQGIKSIAAQKVAVSEIKAITLAELMKSEGRVLGTIKYAKQNAATFFKEGQVKVLNQSATVQKIQKLMTARYATIFKTTANLEETIVLRNQAVKLRAEQLTKALEQSTLIQSRLLAYGKITNWTEFFASLNPQFLWEELGYNLKNFYDRYFSMIKLEHRNRFKAVMNHEVLAKTDDVSEVFWNPQSNTFRFSGKNAAQETAERIVVDPKTAAEITDLMKIAEMNDLAKEFMVNERLLSYLDEAKSMAFKQSHSETKIAISQQTAADGMTLPSVNSSEAYEREALELFFNNVSASGQWHHVNPIFSWATSKFEGLPSVALKDLRQAMKDQNILMAEAWSIEEARLAPQMKAQTKAQKTQEKAYEKQVDDLINEIDKRNKEKVEYTPYEEVVEDVYEFELTQDGIKRAGE